MNTKEIKQEISKLSSSDILDILHDCVGLLVPLSPANMAEFCNRSKKAILNRMEDNKYMIFEFDNRKFPIVNDHLPGNK